MIPNINTYKSSIDPSVTIFSTDPHIHQIAISNDPQPTEKITTIPFTCRIIPYNIPSKETFQKLAEISSNPASFLKIQPLDYVDNDRRLLAMATLAELTLVSHPLTTEVTSKLRARLIEFFPPHTFYQQISLNLKHYDTYENFLCDLNEYDKYSTAITYSEWFEPSFFFSTVALTIIDSISRYQTANDGQWLQIAFTRAGTKDPKIFQAAIQKIPSFTWEYLKRKGDQSKLVESIFTKLLQKGSLYHESLPKTFSGFDLLVNESSKNPLIIFYANPVLKKNKELLELFKINAFKSGLSFEEGSFGNLLLEASKEIFVPEF